MRRRRSRSWRKEKKGHEFLSGFFVGFAFFVMVAAIILDIAIWKYGDTVESIYVLARNAVTTSFEKEEVKEKKKFSSTEVAAKLTMLNAYIEQYYLRENDVEAEEEAVYKALLGALNDPYSVYYTKEEYEEMNERFEGSYVGIGVTAAYHKKTGKISIDEITEGSGASEAGLKVGDIFSKIEGQSIDGMDLQTLASLLKGEEGSSILVSVIRKGEKEELNFEVERKEVSLQTVEYEMLEENIGYVLITGFSNTTPKQFNQALQELLTKGAKGFVIDLRNNGGGSFSAAVDMLDRLLPKGLLVYTKTKDGEKKKYNATDKEVVEQPFTVLINEKSASASEIFAGAIKDRKAGTIVGTTSFGKGIVQKIYPLDDGSAIKLTNSEYFTPNGNNIHGIGIEPDIKVEMDQGDQKEEQDLQLKKAIEIVKQE